jgi:hypothetical protein
MSDDTLQHSHNNKTTTKKMKKIERERGKRECKYYDRRERKNSAFSIVYCV